MPAYNCILYTPRGRWSPGDWARVAARWDYPRWAPRPSWPRPRCSAACAPSRRSGAPRWRTSVGSSSRRRWAATSRIHAYKPRSWQISHPAPLRYTYVAELNGAGLAELRYRKISRLRLDEQLAQGHLLASEHRPHRGAGGDARPGLSLPLTLSLGWKLLRLEQKRERGLRWFRSFWGRGKIFAGQLISREYLHAPLRGNLARVFGWWISAQFVNRIRGMGEYAFCRRVSKIVVVSYTGFICLRVRVTVGEYILLIKYW